MKRTLAIVLLLAITAAMFIPVPASAKDGELLIAVDFLNDTFRTINNSNYPDVQFTDKFDLSNSTSTTLMPSKKADCTTDAWNADLAYIEDSGYYITEETKYTIYFEVAAAHNNKYSAVPFLCDTTDGFDSISMLFGAFSDDGDNSDGEGGKWTETAYAYDYAKIDHILGVGYNSKKLMYSHPALTTEILAADTCKETEITEYKFSTWKIELDGLNVTSYYLNAEGAWVKNKNTTDNCDVEYTANWGSQIILGTYSRNEERHNVIRNIKLFQGVGMTAVQMEIAEKTTEPKPAKPETTAAETTKAPETTKKETTTTAPATTKAPDTTKAPETTKAAETKSGCGSVAAIGVAVIVSVLGCAIIRKKQ